MAERTNNSVHEQRMQLETDGIAIATYNAHWIRRRVNWLDTTWTETNTAASLDKIEQDRTAVEAFVNKNLSGQSIDRHTLGIGQSLDSLFTALEWQRHRSQTNDLSDLAYFGVDHHGLESVWGDISEIAEYYVAKRGIDLDLEEMDQLLATRKSITGFVVEQINKELKSFSAQHTALTEATIITFFRSQEMNNPTNLNLETQALKDKLTQVAEDKLAEELGVATDQVPVNYKWIHRQESLGVVVPQYTTLVAVNRAIMAGEQISLYCCPNYTLERREDGTFVYTFEGLGTNIGLTAERGLPFINSLIERATMLKRQGLLANPVRFRIAIADFEATEENAAMVDLTVDQFRCNLGLSVMSIVREVTQNFCRQNGESPEICQIQRTNPDNEPIGEWAIALCEENEPIAQLSFGAVTKTYCRQVQDYKGDQSFNDLVENAREVLEKQAQTDRVFQSRLDALLKLRLGLMLRWRDGSEPSIIHQLGTMFDNLSDTDFEIKINGTPEFHELKAQINEIILNPDFSEGERNVIIKAVIVNWLIQQSAHDPTVAEGLSHLRRKVARQGAEYRVMSKLQAQSGVGAQIVADSAAMWDVFGGRQIPRMAIKGGYEGA